MLVMYRRNSPVLDLSGEREDPRKERVLLRHLSNVFQMQRDNPSPLRHVPWKARGLWNLPVLSGVQKKRIVHELRLHWKNQLLEVWGDGTGRVESEWSRSLRTQSVDRLKLEHEKRSQKIVAMDSQIFDLQEEYWGRGREGNIDGDLRHLRSNIAEFEGEVSAIEEELDRRHGITGADSNQPFEAQSTERLKLEHQKRQRAVLALEKRITDLQEMYWGEGREGDIDNDLSSYRREIRSLSDEMAAIERVLDQR